MNVTANANDNALEPTVRALRQLSPSSQGAVIALVGQLAESEGLGFSYSRKPRFLTWCPAEYGNLRRLTCE